MMEMFTEGNFPNVKTNWDEWELFMVTVGTMAKQFSFKPSPNECWDAMDELGNLHGWYHDGIIDVISEQFNTVWLKFKG